MHVHNPGIKNLPDASITCAPDGVRLAPVLPMWLMRLPLIVTVMSVRDAPVAVSTIVTCSRTTDDIPTCTRPLAGQIDATTRTSSDRLAQRLIAKS